MANLEQDFDAVVGRFVNWLGGDPLRHHHRLRTKAPAATERIETVIAEAHEEHEEEAPAPKKRRAAAKAAPAPAKKKAAGAKKAVAKKAVAKKAVAKKAVAKKAVAKKAVAKKAVAKKAAPARKAAAKKAASPEEVLLAALEGSASMSDLVKRTGETRYALTERLKKLQAEGLVERVGAGLKTRYERIGK